MSVEFTLTCVQDELLHLLHGHIVTLTHLLSELLVESILIWNVLLNQS